MATNEKESNILEFKKKKQLNIGIIIFGIIFIYLIATIIMYITAPHITVYEVRQGSILKDNAYTGLAIRDEIVVEATESGYINYFAQDNSKVKVGSDIYTLTSSKLNFEDKTTEENVALTSEARRNITLKVQKFLNDYKETNFSDVYDLKNDLKSSLGSLSSKTKHAQLDSMVSQGYLSNANIYQTDDDGVVVYSVDGMESLTLESATLKNLDKSDYHKTEFSNNARVKAGDAIYKIITDDAWALMIEVDNDTANVLKDKTYVKVNFTKDNQTVWANLKINTVDGNHLAYLFFENAMVRYAAERFLDVKLILEDESGLKIPKTAMTEKEFYIVPMDYIMQGGGNSTGSSVLVQTRDNDDNEIVRHMEVDIYYQNEEEGIVYLDPNQFDKNVTLQKENSNEIFNLKEKRSLKGVYCINKGYAMFKQIHILCESDTYYIVEEGSAYGLSNYDHIALYSANIKENDVVF